MRQRSESSVPLFLILLIWLSVNSRCTNWLYKSLLLPLNWLYSAHILDRVFRCLDMVLMLIKLIVMSCISALTLRYNLMAMILLIMRAHALIERLSRWVFRICLLEGLLSKFSRDTQRRQALALPLYVCVEYLLKGLWRAVGIIGFISLFLLPKSLRSNMVLGVLDNHIVVLIP
jgi:hypothetical protein